MILEVVRFFFFLILKYKGVEKFIRILDSLWGNLNFLSKCMKKFNEVFYDIN